MMQTIKLGIFHGKKMIFLSMKNQTLENYKYNRKWVENKKKIYNKFKNN